MLHAGPRQAVSRLSRRVGAGNLLSLSRPSVIPSLYISKSYVPSPSAGQSNTTRTEGPSSPWVRSFHSSVPTHDRRQAYIDTMRSFFDDQGHCEQKKALRQWIHEGEVDPSHAARWLISFYCLTVSPKSAHNALNTFLQIAVSPDQASYVTLMQGYSKNNDIQAALAVYEEATRHGVAFDEASHTMLLNLCLRGNESLAAAQIAILMREMRPRQLPDLITLHELLKQMVASDYDLLEPMTKLIALIKEDVSMKALRFNELLSSAAWDQPERVDQLCRVLENEGIEIESNVYSNIISGYVRQGALPQAESVAQYLIQELGIELTFSQLSSLLSGCVARGNLSRAQEYMDVLLEFTEKRLAKTSGQRGGQLVVPTTTMLSGFLDRDRLDDALELLKKLEARIKEGSIVLLDVFFEEAMSARRLDLAGEAITQLFLRDYYLSHTSSEARQIFDRLCESLILAHIQEQSLEQAQQLLQTLHEKGYSNAPAMNRLFNSCVNCGYQTSEEILTIFQELGMEIQSGHYNMIIGKCVADTPPHCDEALQVFQRMKASGLDPPMATYTTILSSLIQAGRFTDTKAICQDLQARDSDFPSSYAVSGICRSALEKHPASDVLSLMETFQATIKYEPDTDILLPMVAMASYDRDLLTVFHILNLATQKNICTRALYAKAIAVLLERGDSQGATRVFKSFQSLCKEKVMVLDPEIASMMVNHLLKERQVSAALTLLEDFKAVSSVPMSLVCDTVKTLWKQNDQQMAWQMIRQLSEFHLTPDMALLSAFIDAMTPHADMNDLLQMVDTLHQQGLPRAPFVYVELLQLALKRSDLVVAQRIFEDMIQQDIRPDLSQVYHLGNSLLHHGDVSSAIAVFQRALQLRSAPEQLAVRIIHHCALTHNVHEGCRFLQDLARENVLVKSEALQHLFEVVAPVAPSKAMDILKSFGTQMNVSRVDLFPLVQGMLRTPAAFKVLWKNLESLLRSSLPPSDYENSMRALYQQLGQHPHEWSTFQKLTPTMLQPDHVNASPRDGLATFSMLKE